MPGKTEFETGVFSAPDKQQCFTVQSSSRKSHSPAYGSMDKERRSLKDSQSSRKGDTRIPLPISSRTSVQVTSNSPRTLMGQLLSQRSPARQSTSKPKVVTKT